MRLALLAASTLALTVASAGADVIEDRKAAMDARQNVMRVLGPIAQGQQPFDAEVVLSALQDLNEVVLGEDIMDYFPEGSHEGDTRAAPAIWEQTDDFVAIETTFATNVQAAIDAAPDDVDAFRAAFGPIGAQCGACHERFRTQ